MFCFENASQKSRSRFVIDLVPYVSPSLCVSGCVSLRKSNIEVLNPKRIRKWILCFFTKQINPRSFGSECIKGTEESTSRVDSSVHLTRHYLRNLGSICLVKKRKISFGIPSNLRIQSWIFLKKRTLSVSEWHQKRVRSVRLRTFTGLNDGAVKVNSIGYYIVVFVSCDSVRVDANVNNFFF